MHILGFDLSLYGVSVVITLLVAEIETWKNLAGAATGPNFNGTTQHVMQ